MKLLELINGINSTHMTYTGVATLVGGALWWLFSRGSFLWPLRILILSLLFIFSGMLLSDERTSTAAVILSFVIVIIGILQSVYVRSENEDNEPEEQNTRFFAILSTAVGLLTVNSYFYNPIIFAATALSSVTALWILFGKYESIMPGRLGIYSAALYFGACASLFRVNIGWAWVWIALSWTALITHFIVLKIKENEYYRDKEMLTDALAKDPKRDDSYTKSLKEDLRKTQPWKMRLYGLVTLTIVAISTIQYFEIYDFKELISLVSM